MSVQVRPGISKAETGELKFCLLIPGKKIQTGIKREQMINFGTAQVDGQGRIKGWEEKPKEPKGTLASLGIYIFRRPYLLKVLQDPKPMDFGRDLIPSVIKKDRVFAYPFSGYWRGVGTLSFYS